MADDAGAGLPASLAAAWGLRGRPPKGPKPGLSLERIVAAAIRVADTEGLPAVSMSRVATELGTGPMSLYRYVAAKDELLGLMVDAAFGPPPEGPSGPGVEAWRPGMARWAWEMRIGMRRHPWVTQIPIGGLPIRPNEVTWFEAGLRCLGGTGLQEEEKGSVILLISGYVRNDAAQEADIEAAVRGSGKTPDEWMASYAGILATVADPLRFPALRKFIEAGVFDHSDPPEREFSFGLERLLDGIDVLVQARR